MGSASRIVMLTHSADLSQLCRFDNSKRSADDKLNSAQQKVDSIQNTINHLKWWEKFELPGLEAALYTAKGVLAAAKWVGHLTIQQSFWDVVE